MIHINYYEKGLKYTMSTYLDKMFLLSSALQKAIRWGEINDARYFAEEIMRDGKPGTALNRLITIAAEDVGFADPTLVKYVGQRYDEFERWEKKSKVKRSKVFDYLEALSIIDRAVIAAALCRKSRLLPMASFVTLYDIYKNEALHHDLNDCKDCFIDAVRREDEEGALRYAYIAKEIYKADTSILAIIKDIEDEEGIRNSELINEWIKVYTREKKDRNRLLFVGIILLLCRELDYDHGEYLKLVDSWVSKPIERADIPDRAYDKHTRIGKRMGRGLEHFLSEGASVRNEPFPNDWEDRGKQAYLEAEKKGLEDTSKLIAAITEKYEARKHNNFIIDLPFKYKKAVLTQAATHNDGIYTFIVEFHDGNRKFIKGPYKKREKAEKPFICNEIKKRLNSVHLHPIECEIRKYDKNIFFLVCEELGVANLDNRVWHKTKMDGTFEMLKYDVNNDFVSEPFKHIKAINKKNNNTWVQIIVNYCFRWSFGIGDASPRNLMLQRSTGKIYSIDEASIDAVNHESIWNKKNPGKETIGLVRKFVDDEKSLAIVIDEVSRWKHCLKDICDEFNLNALNIETRIDKFLRDPGKVLIFVK